MPHNRKPAQPHNRTHPFTAILCHGPACGPDPEPDEGPLGALRECVRRNRHGVLISAGCLLDRLTCRTVAGTAQRPAGPLLVVQPCRNDRSPIGPAHWLGPLSTPDDIAAVCRWLDAGDLSILALPAHLRFRTTIARHATAH